MEPETEVVVFGILVTYFNIFSGDIEMLLAKGRVEVVIVEHHSWLYPAIKGYLVPIAVEKEPWAKTDFLNGGVVAFVHSAWDDAPATILPLLSGDFSTWCQFMLLDGGLLNLDEKADIGCEDLCHLAVAKHDVTTFLVGEEAMLLAWVIDNTDGGKELLACHVKEVGELRLGVHTVENLLNLIEILVGLGLMHCDRLLRLLASLLTYLLYVLTNLLLGRDFEKVASLLVELVI